MSTNQRACYNQPDVGDEAHVQHLVALVQHQALDVGETHLEYKVIQEEMMIMMML